MILDAVKHQLDQEWKINIKLNPTIIGHVYDCDDDYIYIECIESLDVIKEIKEKMTELELIEEGENESRMDDATNRREGLGSVEPDKAEDEERGPAGKDADSLRRLALDSHKIYRIRNRKGDNRNLED